jgi:hypothetical protein
MEHTDLQTLSEDRTEDLDAFNRFASPEHAKKQGLPKEALLSFVLLGILILSAINSIGLVGIYLLYNSSATNRKTVTLVQLNDGKSIAATSVDSNTRSPEVIKRFVAIQIASLMSWSVQLSTDVTQGGNPVLDSGIEVTGLRGAKKKVPTTVWQASFAFSEDFRNGILASIAELVPPQVFTGASKSVLIIKSISTPEEIEKGKWKVTLVSNLVTFTSANQAGESIAFNKEVFIQAVDLPIAKADAAPLDEAIFRVRSSGLEIYAMRDLARENLK